ncbi:MAG: hypothetical protein N2V77_02405 [Canidatus Methanoxibalbensis ujae]|nr:hypothetical protein [Candidatus Methanoxibalbensis ujae]MCW7078734.1 hypothetical protein [Candidatus Methanoxibalbensis ujae]
MSEEKEHEIETEQGGGGDELRGAAEDKYEIVIPRGIATGIVFEAAEKFGLEVDQEVRDEDVPKIVLRGDSPEIMEMAHKFIYEKHKQWIESIEEQRRIRRERIMRKMRRRKEV